MNLFSQCFFQYGIALSYEVIPGIHHEYIYRSGIYFDKIPRIVRLMTSAIFTIMK
jgi:hypothetical protein